MGKIRQGLLVLLIAALTACGGGKYSPRGDAWSGFTFPPSFIQYFIEGIIIHEIYLDGVRTGNSGFVLYLPDKSGGSSGFGIYNVKDKSGNAGGGIVFLDEALNAGIVFGSFPLFPGTAMMAFIQKTQQNIPLDFLYDDIQINWVGVTKVSDGTTVTTETTFLYCGLSSSCNYTRGSISGSVSGVAYSDVNHIWTGYFSEPDTGRSGDSYLALTADKTVAFMINCDTDHKSPLNYLTDCTYFMGIPTP